VLEAERDALRRAAKDGHEGGGNRDEEVRLLKEEIARWVKGGRSI
jgi:hypothetical protein